MDEFDLEKIAMAIFKAAEAVGGRDMETARHLANLVVIYLRDEKKVVIPAVEEVQDAVEKILIENGHAKTAKAYILYRDRRTRIREGKSELMDAVAETLVETNRENANVGNSPSAKMLQIASAASRQYYLSRLIPEDMAQAHCNGDIHIHDLDFYAKTLTCVQIPLGRLLHTGFDTGHGFIRPPKRPASAAALAAIILQSSQNDMHGGQSFAFFDRDMADFVADSDENEVFQAMEGLVYNLNSMHSRAGSTGSIQLPQPGMRYLGSRPHGHPQPSAGLRKRPGQRGNPHLPQYHLPGQGWCQPKSRRPEL